MKLIQILILPFIALFCFTKIINAQNYSFKHLGAEDGLSSNIVRHINKDTRGYLWICCDNALNRYNGDIFKKYIHNPGDSTSITSGGISSTLEDNDGILWISTKNGVSTFDYKTEKFKRVFEIQEDSSFIRNLYLTKANELLVVVNTGIYIFNREQGKFIKFLQSPINRSASVIAEDNYGNLYLGTGGNGIVVISSDRKRNFLREIPSITDFKNANSIASMVVDKKGKLWIGSRNGFFCANTSKNINELNFQISQVLNNDGKILEISFNMIHSLAIDESNKIWIGTENGLNIYDPETQKLHIEYSTKKSPGGLSNNLILHIYNDKSKGIWIGTYQGGMNFYSKGNIPFPDKIPFINHTENKLIQYVKSVYQQPDGKLWVGTDFGLLRFSENFQLEKTYTYTGQPGSLPIGGVTAIHTDKFNNFWVGTWGGGVSRLDSITGKFVSYSRLDGENKTDSMLTADCNIVAIKEDINGDLWIVNKFKVIDRYNHRFGSFKQIDISRQIGRPNMEITSVDKDENDNLWIGATGAGLIKFDTKTLESELFAPSLSINPDLDTNIPSTNVYSVHVHKSGKIWLGTAKGLSQLDSETKKFVNYSTENGLNSETVLGVISDNNENIWLSTLNGISRLDTAANNFLNYNVDEGVVSNAEVAYKSTDGMLFFGGVNGITVFHPDSIWRNELAPPIVFTDFKLFDKSILFNNKILPFHINEVNDIVLDYSQNNITINFMALNFIQQNKNVYACKLEGFDKEWKYLGSTNEIKYPNLNPGTYYFKVKAANNSGVWNNTERVLKISVRTPWWKTLIFRISAIILIIGMVFLVIRLRTIQLVYQKEELEQKVHERTREIEKQQVELQKQAEKLMETNTLLVFNQKEIESQKESINRKKILLEEKNEILEQQKEQILFQKIETERMAAKLHEADQKKINFLTNISHEFRTPLSLIFSPLDKSLREFGNIDKEKLHTRLKLMYRNTLRLLRLINEFLDLSKIEAGLLKLCVGKGNISNYISGIVESYRYLAEQKNIRMSYRSEMASVNCFFDADKIEKILNNLLSNAFKFTPNGGEIHVELLVFEKSKLGETERLQICVKDNGVGIDEKFQKQIFERFFQIEDKEEQTSGTGIGLALTQELISIYRGNIELDSEPGKGSAFKVTLPCSAAHFQANEISSESISGFHQTNEWYFSNELAYEELPVNDEMKPDAHKPVVLLVEDNNEIVRFLKEEFSNEFNFVFANDGFKGFEKAVTILPHAIILDVMMPKMNGYQLCEKLKNDDRTCHIPIIFLTALAEKSEQLEGLEYGADDYITKPFDIDLLKIKINNLIESRKMLKLLYQKKMSLKTFELIPDSADEKLIDKILKIIDREIANSNFGVEELSKNVGLSRTHLYRKVRELTNQSPVELIRNLRLGKAAKLLRENKFYVSEVAYMTGFTELSYFRKIFKDFYGVSPSDCARGIIPIAETEKSIELLE
jgi:signal transduction histidine kinase/ligand-binding sensor domain-containing protein/DNA-binding response OmpR family regulator